MIEFYVLAFVLIASAIFVVTAQKAVYSVVGLLVHFAALAIMYFSLAAEFLAVIQIIVYSGAILMLFVFVIALLSSGVAPFNMGPNRLPKIAVPALLIVAVSLGFMVYGIAHSRRARSRYRPATRRPRVRSAPRMCSDPLRTSAEPCLRPIFYRSRSPRSS